MVVGVAVSKAHRVVFGGGAVTRISGTDYLTIIYN
jgi:hypothetical protein